MLFLFMYLHNQRSFLSRQLCVHISHVAVVPEYLITVHLHIISATVWLCKVLYHMNMFF